MFAYSSSETIIPSLTFTKAELAYTLFVLLKDIPFTNNSDKIELVEVRHFINQIKNKVLLSTHDGSLRNAIADSVGMEVSDVNEEPNKEKEETKASLPSIKELKEKFPTLSEEEIRDILERERIEQKKKREAEKPKQEPNPPKTSFIVKEEDMISSTESNEKSPTIARNSDVDKETSFKFANLLGAS